MWLVGNSHTFGFPFPEPGRRIRSYGSGITIDRLAAGAQELHPDLQAEFYLLAYGNFLPFEMLTRTAELLHQGHRPKIVFVGLMWRNLATGFRVRHDIVRSFADEAFVADFERMLKLPDVQADPAILEAVRAQRRRIDFDKEQQRVRSIADTADEKAGGLDPRSLARNDAQHGPACLAVSRHQQRRAARAADRRGR